MVTGKIDTTSESSPLKLAVIAVDHIKVFLNLDTIKYDNNEIHEEYSGNGYNLDLTYKEKKEDQHSLIYEGHLTVTHNNLKSEYKIVRISGYR